MTDELKQKMQLSGKRTFWSVFITWITLIICNLWIAVGLGYDVIPQYSSGNVYSVLIMAFVPAGLYAAAGILLLAVMLPSWVHHVLAVDEPEQPLNKASLILFGVVIFLVPGVSLFIVLMLLYKVVRCRHKNVQIVWGLCAVLCLIITIGKFYTYKFAISINALNWGLEFLLVVFGGLFLALIPLISGNPLTWGKKIMIGIFILLASATFIAMEYSVYYAQNIMDSVKQELKTYNAPFSNAELKEFYFYGNSPNKEFSYLVDSQIKPQTSKVEIEQIYAVSDEQWAALNQAMTADAELFETYDKIFSSSGVLYNVDFDVESIQEVLLPHLSYFREITKTYRLRIMQAVRQNNITEAMRLYRCSNNLVLSCLEDRFLIGVLVSYSINSIHWDAVSVMLMSGSLTPENMVEIQADLQNLLPLYLTGIKNAYRIETALSLVWADEIIEKYKKHREQLWMEDKIVLELNNFFNTPMHSYFMYYKIHLLRELQSVIKTMDKADFNPITDEFYENDKTKRYIISNQQLGSWGRYIGSTEAALARNNIMQMAFEVESYHRQHGRYPATLAEAGEQSRIITAAKDCKYIFESGNLEYSEYNTKLGDYQGFRITYKNLILPYRQPLELKFVIPGTMKMVSKTDSGSMMFLPTLEIN